MENDVYFINEAYKEALKAYKEDEIPVGAIIVKDGKIIAKAHNKRDQKQIVTKHAEIIAIEKANKKLKNWRLNDCILYSTLEPCNMCQEVIKSSKIKQVIYGASSNNQMNQKEIEYKKIEDETKIKQCSSLIQEAFNQIRKR